MRIVKFTFLLTLFGLVLAEDDLCPLNSCVCLGNNVECSSRKLTLIPPNIPKWTETLFLQNNNFKELGSQDLRDLPALINVKILDLSSSQLQELPQGFSSLFPNLEQLTLRNNDLKSVPNQLLNLQRTLQILDLRGNKIPNISSITLTGLSQLHKLDVGKNLITELPNPSFTKASTLKELYLDGNKISFLRQGSFGHLSQLKTLKLNKNRIRVLSKGVFTNLTQLLQLDLSRNRIRQLSGLTFSGLGSLRSLKLNRNGLKYMEDGTFWGLQKLRELQLKQNKIMQITKGWIYGMEELQRLHLRDNSIMMLENTSFSHLPNLAHLDLSSNRIEKLTAWNLRPLSSLMDLNFYGNKLSSMTNLSLAGLNKLQNLDLSHNQLASTIEDSRNLFALVPQLRTLKLIGNEVRTLSDTCFVKLEHLTLLDLTSNPITSLPPLSFQGLESLNHLYINSTSLVCDCHLDWLPDWMRIHHFEENELVCGDVPKALAGVSLYEADITKMTCEKSPKPVIIEHPSNSIGLQENNTSFRCVAIASPNITVTAQWKRDDMVLYEDEGSLQMRNSVVQLGDGMVEFTSVLSIIDLVQADTANYQCIISNRFGAAYSKRAKLTVYVYPSFLRTPENVTRSVGQTARLVCAALGYPKPEIKWEKDGGENDFPAATDRRMHVMANDDVFFIVQLKTVDAGVYTCKASNAAGEIRSSAILTIKERPTVMKGMEDETAEAGSTVVLECVVMGFPKPNIKWYFAGSPLIVDDRRKLEGDNQILVILSVSSFDQGEYACEIENQLGITREQANLTVIGDVSDAKVGRPISPGVTAAPPVDNSLSAMLLLYLSDPIAVLILVIVLVVSAIVVTSVIWVGVIYCRTNKNSDEEESVQSGHSRTPLRTSLKTPVHCKDETKGLVGPCSPAVTLERDGRVWQQTNYQNAPLILYSPSNRSMNRDRKRAVYRVIEQPTTLERVINCNDNINVVSDGSQDRLNQVSPLDLWHEVEEDSGVNGDSNPPTQNSSPNLDERNDLHTPPPLPPRKARSCEESDVNYSKEPPPPRLNTKSAPS